MLHHFIVTNQDAIIARTRGRLASRSGPPAEQDCGVYLLLTQLSETRRLEGSAAEAVTEPRPEARSADEVEQLGQAAHEFRDNLNMAILAFGALKEGDAGINSSAGSLLGRSLMRQHNLIDRTLSDARLSAQKQQRERLLVVTLLDQIAATSMLYSESCVAQFTVEPIDHDLAVNGDSHLLMSAVMNLLRNALRHTPVGGRVVMRSRSDRGSLVVEVEDQCGGIPDSKGGLLHAISERRGTGPSQLGQGLTMARQAVTAHGGRIHVRNMPGKGCVFVIEVPLAVGVHTQS